MCVSTSLLCTESLLLHWYAIESLRLFECRVLPATMFLRLRCYIFTIEKVKLLSTLFLADAWRTGAAVSQAHSRAGCCRVFGRGALVIPQTQPAYGTQNPSHALVPHLGGARSLGGARIVEKMGVSAFVWPVDRHGQLAPASRKRTSLSRSPTLASLPFLIRRSLAGSLPSTLA